MDSRCSVPRRSPEHPRDTERDDQRCSEAYARTSESDIPTRTERTGSVIRRARQRAKPISSVASWIRDLRLPGALDATEMLAVMRTNGMIRGVEAQTLAGLARQTPGDKAIVEVGSYQGRSTIALALGSARGASAPIYAVEPHDEFIGALGGHFGPEDRRHFFQNLLRARVVDRVHLVGVSSEIVTPGWRQPVGLLWIDGDHTYEGVRRDADCWLPLLDKGAIVAFHDATDPRFGPSRLVAELEAHGNYRRVGTSLDIVIMERC